MWCLVALAIFGGVLFYQNLGTSANELALDRNSGGGNVSSLSVKVSPQGYVYLNGEKYSRRFTPLKKIDRIQFKLVDNAKANIPVLDVYIKLPQKIGREKVKIIPRLEHNINPKVEETAINKDTLLYTARDIGVGADYSFELNFAKNELKPPLSVLISSFLINRSLYFWLTFALLLPLASIVVLISANIKKLALKKAVANLPSINRPPSDLPPAAVEALLFGRISEKSVAATLLDLAARGYIVIGYHDNDFRIGRNKSFKLPSRININDLKNKSEIEAILRSVAAIKDSTDLKLFERLLLSKIFTSKQMIADRETVESRIEHRLFSEKIARFFAEVYEIDESYDYFIADPVKRHLKYKVAGVIMFYLGFLGFLTGSAYFPEPKTALLIWVGMMLASLEIIKSATKIPILSKKGLGAYRDWSAFRKYLQNPKPFNGTAAETNKEFEKFLPYAVAMGVEKEWTARFRNQPFRPPSWYSSKDPYLTLQNFDAELFSLVEKLGRLLSLSRAPNVD